MTGATRRAANASAVAVVAFAVLWFLTTQVQAVRAFSPFADDPWDAFATYAAIFLPFVAGPTWVRSLCHRGPVLPALTARRIRWGSSVAAAIVLIAAAVDLEAIVTIGWPSETGVVAIGATALTAIAALAAAAAVVLVAQAARVAGATLDRAVAGAISEPDLVDDLLALALDVSRVLGLRRPVDRFATWLEQFLDGSAVSPRRHRIAFGVVLAVAAALAFDVWHAIREGPWISLTVPVVFGILVATGILAIYLGTLGPLRLLRPPRS